MNISRRDSLLLLTSALVSASHQSHGQATPPIMQRPIPSTGENLPVIGLGTWQKFDISPESASWAAMNEILVEFVRLGGTLVDSSPMYGKSEEAVGKMIAAHQMRSSLFVATKVWTQGKSEGIAQMEASMKKLGTPTIDLMQVHNLLDLASHMDTIRAWKEAGRIRYLGITHYHQQSHDAVEKVLATEVVDFLQINYSVAERHAEARLLPLARDRGVAVIVNRPFAGGDVFAKLSKLPLPTVANEVQCRSWAQLLLKFIISHPAVTCAIPATSKISHLRDNLQAGLGELPDHKQRQKIAEAIKL